MSMIPNAMESTPPVGGPMPPDRQEMSLGDHLRAALAILGRDGQILPDEQFELTAFMQGVKMIAEGRMMQGQPLAPSPAGEPAGEFQQGETQEYGAENGSYPDDGQGDDDYE